MDKDRYTADPSEIEEIKRQINQEPAEGEVEAFVGSEDEIRLAKEAKKKEGKVETLGEYIRLNKQTLATAEELEMVLKDRKREDLLEEFSNKPTGAWLYNGADVYFKDKDGNFATFQLAYNDRCKNIRV